jgi:23S rRNA pseudouridine1911/1915/1917 synthase
MMSSHYSPGARSRLTFTVPVELAGLRLDQALARLLPEHSRSRIASWMRAGEVHVGGARAKPKQKVWGGEQVELGTEAELAATVEPHAPEALALDIVYEDGELIVIDKPAGLVVHPGNGNRRGTMLNALLHHAPALARIPRAGIVHRLDKDTSGLLVVAKTLPAQTSLVRQLQQRTVGRIYCALVYGDVTEPGCVDAAIGRHPVHRTRMAVVPSGRSARTHFRPVERFGNATRVECKLDTGRTHQIRVHLAAIGHPILGDPTYGPRRATADNRYGLKRQALHAIRLELDHPLSGVRMHWRSPLPADIRAALDQLRTAAGHAAS